jgi:hypothetical protein
MAYPVELLLSDLGLSIGHLDWGFSRFFSVPLPSKFLPVHLIKPTDAICSRYWRLREKRTL